MSRKGEVRVQFPSEPVAIVGMACRFPGDIQDPRQLWDFLLKGKNGIVDVPPTRWDADALYDPDTTRPGKMNIKRSGFIHGIDMFDAQFFGIAPVEAARMDPQQRLLMEVSYEALEDAGIRLQEVDGSRTGVFIGITGHDYFEIVTGYGERRNIGPHTNTGGYGSIASNRISYFYNLKGPSFSVDTACSSSLVALHLACRSLRTGECDLALVGGVNALLKAEPHIAFSKGNFLSPDCQCKAFDRKANGYVRSEGAGIVVLRPLSRALEDGDRIYALVLGSAINQDGRTPGITLPSQEAQQDMLREAQEDAGISADEIQYVEAHGTGTQAGDSAEANAIGEAAGRLQPPGEVIYLGSVKTNLGHLEPASGVAGLMKLALSLKHRRIPGSLHFQDPNPAIRFEEYHLSVPTGSVGWPRPERRLCGGVNSFGFGGANAHAILAESPEAPAGPGASLPSCCLFAISARSPAALRDLARKYVEVLSGLSEPLPAICAVLRQRRTPWEHRLAVVGRTKEEVSAHLQRYLDGGQGIYFHAERQGPGKLAFVFSGQGPQWYAMGRELLESRPVFKATVQTVGDLLRALGWLEEEGGDLLGELSRSRTESRFDQTHIAQPALFAIQVGLFELWRSLGVEPDAVVGHSIGEAAASYASGCLSLEEATRIVFWRSRCQRRLENRGRMLAVGLPAEEALLLCSPPGGGVDLATVNGPRAVVLAGDAQELERIAGVLSEEQVFNRFVNVNVPFHSAITEILREEFTTALGPVQAVRGDVRLYSTVTGRRICGSELNNAYWFDNIRKTVQFHSAVQAMIADGHTTFVELSPHPILSAGIEETLQDLGIPGLCFPSLRRNEPEEALMLDSQAQLWVRGCLKDRIHPVSGPSNKGKTRHIDLPSYPWQHERHWIESVESERERLGTRLHPHLKSFKRAVAEPGDSIWEVDLDPRVEPYLADHVIDGAIVLPAAGHLDLAWSVGRLCFGSSLRALEDVEFESALILSDSHPSEVQIEVAAEDGRFAIYHRPRGSEQAWKRCSRGTINSLVGGASQAPPCFSSIRERFVARRKLTKRDLYDELISGSSLRLGPSFRVIEELYLGEGEHLGHVRLDDSIRGNFHRFSFHGALLDGCIHGSLMAILVSQQDSGVYLPSQARVCRILAGGASFRDFWFHTRVDDYSPRSLGVSFTVFDDGGALLAEFRGVRCEYLEGSRKGEKPNSEYFYELEWRPEGTNDRRPPVPTGSPAEPGTWVFCRVPDGVRGSLVECLPSAQRHLFACQARHAGLLAPGDAQEASRALLEIQRETGLPVRQVVYCLAGEGIDHDQASCTSLEVSALGLARLIEAVDGMPDPKPGVCLLTFGAQQVTPQDGAVDVFQSPLLGMAQVIMNEYPAVRLSAADVGLKPSLDDLKSFVERLPRLGHGEELAFREGSAQVQVLRRRPDDAAKVKKRIPASKGYHTVTGHPGVLGNLTLSEWGRRDPQPGEIEVRVKAAALNFRDVMVALGLLSEEATEGGLYGKSLGLECSGEVLRTGAGIELFKAGDAVVCFAPDCLSAFAYARECHTFLKPSRLSHRQAAALPLVYLTAHYALTHLCRLRGGEKVLIHAAAGGVGQAAVRLARLAGAEVIATAGDERKQRFLRDMGIEHVFSSRDLSFKEGVLDVTGGRGVDVVLNSLGGKAIAQGLECLAPYGRFVELGKRDIYGDRRMGLKPFGKNLSYSAVDVDRLLEQKPDLARTLTQEILDLVEEGRLEALPIEVFGMDRVAEAFSGLSQGKYIGKVVLSETEDEVLVEPSAGVSFSRQAAYLITGGCGGFGLRVAEWMARGGAGTVVLMGRSGLKGAAAEEVAADIRAAGAEVVVFKGDVARRGDVDALMALLEARGLALRGIIHAAAVFDDAPVSALTADRYRQVIQPKVLGAWNLHRASRELKLDHFVLFSSVSTLYGNPGQAAYVAGNNFLNHLAASRRMEGLPGTAILWGPLLDSGVISKNHKVQSLLTRQGWRALPTAKALSLLEEALAQDTPQVAVLDADWATFAGAFPRLARHKRFAGLTRTSSLKEQANGRSLFDALSAADPAERSGILQGQLKNALVRILGLGPEMIEPHTSLTNLGLDSLMATQLSNWIKLSLQTTYPVMRLMQGPSLFDLAENLLLEIGSGNGNGNGNNGPRTTNDRSDRWLVRSRRAKDPAARLFCFPYTGAGASVYHSWVDLLPPEIELCCFQLPGREERRQEPPLVLPNEAFDRLLAAMEPLLDRPFACYGHSMGGVLSYTLCSKLQRAFGKSPVALFVGATAAPGQSNVFADIFTDLQPCAPNPEEALPDGQLVEFLRRIGAPLDPVRESTWREALPIVRGDILLRNAIDYRTTEKLSCPIRAIGGTNDTVYGARAVEAWKELTDDFDSKSVEGSHLFLLEPRACAQTVGWIADTLLATIRGTAPPRSPALPVRNGAKAKASALLIAGVRSHPLSRRVAGEEGIDLARKFTAATPEFPFCIEARDVDVRRVLAEGPRFSQVVVPGVGLDIKPLEFASEHQPWYGVDLDEGLALRKEMLDRAGLSDRHFKGVAADLRNGEWKQALLRAGFDPRRSTLFIVEGLSMYLPLDALRKLLQELKELGDHGESTVWMDHFSREFFTLGEPSVQSFIARIAKMGEPFVTGFSSLGLLGETGWGGYQTVRAQDLVDSRAPVLNEYLFSTIRRN